MKYFKLQFHSEADFKNFLVLSLLIHFSFFIIVTTKSFLLPSKIIEVPNSIRVDMVALPDKIPDIMTPEPVAPTPVVPAPSPNKPVVPEKKVDLKASQKKALEKLQALSALEKIKKEVSESAKNQKQEAPQATPTYKGNIISSGNSFTGLSKLRVNDYLQNLTATVRNHWVLPQWLSSSNLKAAIVMSIDERGYVVKKEVHISSGNQVFDSSCLAAVEAASPLPPPPDEVRGASIMIRFPFQ